LEARTTIAAAVPKRITITAAIAFTRPPVYPLLNTDCEYAALVDVASYVANGTMYDTKNHSFGD
jgi:hypothetical protein